MRVVVPGGHGTQVVELACDAYVPGAHGSQLTPSTDAEPGSHTAHTALAAPGAEPGGQVVHAALPGCATAPGGHWTHVTPLALPLAVPAGHLSH